jgi:hypothetical protein
MGGENTKGNSNMAGNAAEKTTTTDAPSFKGRKLDMPEIEGYWALKPGAVVEGRAMARFQIENDDGKVRDILVVQVSRDVTAVQKGGKESLVKKNGFIGVGITHKNAELLNYITKRGLVFCKALEKKDIGGGRKMWTYECFGEEGKEAPPPPITSRPAGKSDGEDVPF